MRIVMFYHSLVSDWNHGNAHFLRGVASELIRRGHSVKVFEPADGWSLSNLLREQGHKALQRFERRFPQLDASFYQLHEANFDQMTRGADLVIVHEWNDPRLVAQLGQLRRQRRRMRLLFHDTHHRCVTKPAEMARYDLRYYDGVLAFGRALRDLYLKLGWARAAWTWHEAADTNIFHPRPARRIEGDLVWIGNWGDDERARELEEFLLGPVKALGLRARVYGVRYPSRALRALEQAGIEYTGFLPNAEAPSVLSRFQMTIHVPRRPYVKALPGIPTIRPFEAMACGVPLICSPWSDCEGLFRPGLDYLLATDGSQMRRQMQRLLSDEGLRKSLAQHGLMTILSRHTCSHRVDQLLDICEQIGLRPEASPATRAGRRPTPASGPQVAAA